MSQAVPTPRTITSLSSSGALITNAPWHVMRGRMRANAAAGARAPWLPGWTAGRRASLFAQDVLLRHQRMGVGQTPLDQVFAVPNNLTAVHAPQQHWHLAYAPRVTLRLAASDRGIPAGAGPGRPAQMRDHTMPENGPRLVSTLIERVLTRSERTDTLKTIEHAALANVRHEPGTPAATRTKFAAIAEREGQVQRVFRTVNAGATAAVAAAADRNVAASQSAVQPTSQAMQGHQPASSRNPPPINIEHLADRVVNAIDRRLIAHRERYGRA